MGKTVLYCTVEKTSYEVIISSVYQSCIYTNICTHKILNILIVKNPGAQVMLTITGGGGGRGHVRGSPNVSFMIHVFGCLTGSISPQLLLGRQQKL